MSESAKTLSECAREAEDRLSAWRRGEIRDVPLEDVLRQFHRA